MHTHCILPRILWLSPIFALIPKHLEPPHVSGWRDNLCAVILNFRPLNRKRVVTLKCWKPKSTCITIAMLCGTIVAFGKVTDVCAEPFQDLDFESTTVLGPPYHVIVPGWTTSSNGFYYDTITLDGAAVSIQDGLTPYSGQPRIMYPLSGSYSALLQSGQGPFSTPTTSWISQTGDVPPDANSILFIGDDGHPTLSLNGTVIPTSVYWSGRRSTASTGR